MEEKRKLLIKFIEELNLGVIGEDNEGEEEIRGITHEMINGFLRKQK